MSTKTTRLFRDGEPRTATSVDFHTAPRLCLLAAKHQRYIYIYISKKEKEKKKEKKRRKKEEAHFSETIQNMSTFFLECVEAGSSLANCNRINIFKHRLTVVLLL